MDVDAISLGKSEAPHTWNVGLLGYDMDEVGNQYCCSFPFDKAVDPYGDVILALKMNGEDIPRSHGYPVRAIVPGMLDFWAKYPASFLIFKQGADNQIRESRTPSAQPYKSPKKILMQTWIV